MINGKREAEDNQIELEEPKPAKNLKTNEKMGKSSFEFYWLIKFFLNKNFNFVFS